MVAIGEAHRDIDSRNSVISSVLDDTAANFRIVSFAGV
jgi:hypothetical protein